jgi:hypothetical protein
MNASVGEKPVWDPVTGELDMEELIRRLAPKEPRPRPKVVLVCRDGRVVADAVVIVSPKDKNYEWETEGVVVVRRERINPVAVRLVRERFGCGQR